MCFRRFPEPTLLERAPGGSHIGGLASRGARILKRKFERKQENKKMKKITSEKSTFFDTFPRSCKPAKAPDARKRSATALCPCWSARSSAVVPSRCLAFAPASARRCEEALHRSEVACVGAHCEEALHRSDAAYSSNNGARQRRSTAIVLSVSPQISIRRKNSATDRVFTAIPESAMPSTLPPPFLLWCHQ